MSLSEESTMVTSLAVRYSIVKYCQVLSGEVLS